MDSTAAYWLEKTKGALVTTIDNILGLADHPQFREIAVKELTRLRGTILGTEGQND